ncbi:MAG: hypothetical protein KDD44_01470 [Bdellovibrionales bacterium]|nr:hypothetical protein [Bdellovibrionales bacterium]
MEKAVQYFTDEYLEHCQQMSKTEILQFLDDFRKLNFDPGPLKQVNIRIPERTLSAFKAKAQREGVLYQRKLRELLTEWALS